MLYSSKHAKLTLQATCIRSAAAGFWSLFPTHSQVCSKITCDTSKFRLSVPSGAWPPTTRHCVHIALSHGHARALQRVSTLCSTASFPPAAHFQQWCSFDGQAHKKAINAPPRFALGSPSPCGWNHCCSGNSNPTNYTKSKSNCVYTNWQGVQGCSCQQKCKCDESREYML